jgi:uncharacterized protein YbaP (TraB family)
MKKIFSSLAAIVLLINITFAQTPEYKGLLWKIEGNGLTKPSFLMGSMHVSNRVAFHLSDSFFKAIESVDVVALEINADEWMNAMSKSPYIATKMVNSFLSSANNPENYGFYRSTFNMPEPRNRTIGENLGRELGAINSLLYRTGAQDADFQEDTYLDMFIYQLGKKLGKRVTGLENLEYTYRLNDKAYRPEEDFEKRKEEKIKSDLRRHQLNRLLKNIPLNEVMEDAYRDGDLDLLDSLSRLSDYSTNSHNLIIVHRNLIMAESIDSILQNSSLFAAVGAAHLANTYGVINLLREKGYTLTPIADEKSDYGKDYKERIDTTFIPMKQVNFKSYDGTYEVTVPQTLYEFPEYDGIQLAAFPDMANGATYTVTRLRTFAPMTGMTQEQYMLKLDSLFFENIPGKIDSKKEITVSGFPGYEITNTTKKSDKQRYKIVITPLEILIFKVSGKKNFANTPEAMDFINSVKIKPLNNESYTYNLANNAYTVNLNGLRAYESENNKFNIGFWSKNVQSVNKDGEYFALFNRSNFDLTYIEEDSFELSQFSRFYAHQYGYEKNVSLNSDSFNHYCSRKDIYVHKDRESDTLHLKLISQGKHYFLLVCKAPQPKANAFFESFSFGDYQYQNELELHHDSALFYSVKSYVEPTHRYQDRFRWNDTEDNSYEGYDKNSYAYYPNTDELIWIFMEKYHRFHFENNIDSIWSDCKNELTQEGDFKVIKEIKEGNSYTLHVGDSGSLRCVVGKFILKGGVLYSLKTEIDRNSPLSPFMNTFFETFTPWDTLIENSPLDKKAALLITDLSGKDSIRKKQAISSLDILDIADEEVPTLIEGVRKFKSGENNVKIRIAFLEKIGSTKHPQALPFLESYFKQVDDTSILQIPILTGIAKRRTKKSTKQFAKLLLIEPPLTSDNFVINRMFRPFEDSLKLARDLYPSLLRLSLLPEYKYKSYRMLANLLDSGYIKRRVYKRYVKNIVFEANNELKRQKSKDAKIDEQFIREASRYELYSYNNSLYHYAISLLPYSKRGGARKFYSRINSLNNVGLQLDISALRLRNGKNVSKDLLNSFASNDNHRYPLYISLKKQNDLSYFPSQYQNADDLSISAFASYSNINLLKDSVIFVQKEKTTIDHEDAEVYFFRVKRKNADKWSMGYIAILHKENDSLHFDQEFHESSMEYSEFDEDEIQINRKIRELEMMKRKRFDVLDEPEFEILREPSRGRFYF